MINYQLDGRVAVVTGGASGIGLACAEALAVSGAAVAIWDLSPEALAKAKSHIESYDVRCSTAVVNVADPQAVEAAMQTTIKELGRVDILVNNAGIGGPSANSADYPLDAWQKVIDVNLNGVFYCQRAALQVMRKQGSGSIINMASILGQVAFAGSPAYVAAKHAVVGLTKCAAAEHATDGVRINAVGPGFIHTPLVDEHLPAEVLKMLESKHPVGRLGQAEEVGQLVAWLASDAASFVTGAYYAVDGGYLTV